MKTLIAFAAGGLAGLAAGAGAMLVAFPFLFPPPVLDEPPPAPAAYVGAELHQLPPVMASATQQAPNRISAGMFDETSPGRDPVHWANGGVGVYRQGERLILRLESDFIAGPGPDFHIYLNTRKIGDERDFKADQGRIKLTKLRAFRGGQNYALPPGTDLAAIRSVTIWCERFSEFIANAEIGGGRA